jgi:hypothetical protein
MRTRHSENSDLETARNIADAIAWLSRIATKAGLDSVGRDLLTVRDKLSFLVDKHDAREH